MVAPLLAPPQGLPSGGGGLAGQTDEQPEWNPDSSSPSEVFSGVVRGIEMPDGSTKGCTTEFRVPRNQNLAVNVTLIVPLFVFTAGAGDGNVRLRLTVRIIAIGELTTKAADVTITNTVGIINTVGRMHFTAMVIGAGSFTGETDSVLSLHLERLGADGADTFTGAIGILKRPRFDFDR